MLKIPSFYVVQVEEAKKQIKSEKGNEFFLDNMKLIYQGSSSYVLTFLGQVMVNERSLKSYNVSEKHFIVVLETPKIVDPKTDEPPRQPAPRNTVATPATTTAPTPVSAVEPQVPSERVNVRSEETFLTGPDIQSAIQDIVAMGFERSKVNEFLSK